MQMRGGGTDEQPGKPLLIRVPGSSNLNLSFSGAHKKSFLLER